MTSASDASALAVLCLPGMDGTGALFGAFASSLGPDCRAIAHAYPRDAATTYADYARSVPIPEGRFAIVAESFSGPVGAILAARYADRVSALVLAASFVTSPNPRLLAVASRIPAWMFAVKPPRWAIRFGMLDANVPTDVVDEVDAAVASLEGSLAKARLGLIAHVDVRDELRRVSAPVLYLAASRDRLVTPAAFESIATARPDVTRVEIDAPHLVLQCAPKACADVVTEFVAAPRRRA